MAQNPPPGLAMPMGGPCYGTSYDKSTNTFCCSSNSWHSTSAFDACCGNRLADRRHSLCCSNDVFPKMPGVECCDKRSYDSTHTVCCDGEILPKMYGPFTKCCEKHSYNFQTHECCQSDILPKEMAKFNLMCPSGQILPRSDPPANIQQRPRTEKFQQGQPNRFVPHHPKLV